MVAFSANAQQGKYYIGTSGIGGNNIEFMTGFVATDGNTMIGIAPEIGYFFSDNMVFGLGIGLTSLGDSALGTNFGLNPYVRYIACTVNNFSLYAQADLKYASNGKLKNDYFSFGVIPGIAYSFNDKFAMNCGIGFLGYEKSKVNDVKLPGTFSLLVDGGLNLGLTYSF